MFKFTSQANHLAKLLTIKKDYEREGFHLQRLYKRRLADENGIMRSTIHTIMEPYGYHVGTTKTSSSNKLTDETVKQLLTHCDTNNTETRIYIDKSLTWEDLLGV